MIDHAARLRAAKVLLDTEQCAAIGLSGTAGVCGDAADEIERLQLEYDVLRSENERLRAAMTNYLDYAASATRMQPLSTMEVRRHRQIMRAALAPHEPSGAAE